MNELRPSRQAGSISNRTAVIFCALVVCSLILPYQCSSTPSILLADDKYTDSATPATLSLATRAAPDNRPVRDFVVVGEVAGARKVEHFTGGSFAGGGRIEHYGSRTITATASLAGPSDLPAYQVFGAENFIVSPFANKVTIAPKWSWRLFSRGYCAANGYVANTPFAALAAYTSGAQASGVVLNPLPRDESTRARYAMGLLTSMRLENASRWQAPSIYAALDYLLESAAPTSDDPLANATYVRLLRRWHYAPVNDGRPKNADYLRTFERHVAKRIQAARNIYYIYDDWRVVGDDIQLRWDDANDSNKDCIGESVRAASAWHRQEYRGSLLPLLPKTDFLAHSNNEHNLGPKEEHRLVQPDPLPFCEDKSAIANLEKQKAVLPDASVRSDPEAMRKWQENFFYSRLDRLRLSCRHGDVAKCNVNVLNIDGDTPLLVLARLRAKRQLAFFGPHGFSSGPMFEQLDFRRVNRAIANKLLDAGADPTVVNPVLDTNALEGALDVIIEASYTSAQTLRPSGDAAAHLALVDDFLAYFERTGRGTVRSDYQVALKRMQAKATDTTSRVPTSSGWRLPDATGRRILQLPSRAIPSLCAEDAAFWFREPGRQQENRAFNALQGQDLNPSTIYGMNTRGKDYCCRQPE
jgi:hypothetical protein